MKLDQHEAVHRVSRRRLLRHVASLQRGLAQARSELEGGTLTPLQREKLATLVLRIEREIGRLEARAENAPTSLPGEVVTVYNAADRD